jgi:hypothetical protein
MQRREDAIEFAHRRPPRPRLLVGLGLVGLACLAWWGPVTALTAAVSLGSITLGVLLVASGSPRWEPIRFEPRTGMLEARGTLFTPGDPQRIELCAAAGDALGRARPSYAAFAVRRDGSRVEVLESETPADIVRFGRALEAHLPVIVTWVPGRPHWGDWLSGAEPPPALPSRLVRGRAFARRRKASWTTWTVAAGLGVTWTYFVLRAPSSPTTFSLGLALGSFAFTLLTAALVTFDVTWVTLGDEVRVERRVLGVTVRRLVLPREDILRVTPLTPDGEAGHLLFVTRTGAVSVQLAQPAARRVAQLFMDACEATRRPGEHTERRGELS